MLFFLKNNNCYIKQLTAHVENNLKQHRRKRICYRSVATECVTIKVF